jgi:hypothetical protein
MNFLFFLLLGSSFADVKGFEAQEKAQGNF